MRTWLVVLAGCAGGSGTGGEPGDGSEGSACSSNADCGSDMVCLAYGSGDGGCAPTCSASVDSCGGTASCGGVGLLDVDVCQEQDSASTAPPEDPPRIACREDADCADLGTNLVCGESMGYRQCTLRCDRESDCTMPAVGGFTWDVLTCAPDDGDPSRDVCVFDVACLDDPMSCLSH